jgi:AcrR family transcriptional regulator
MTPEPAADSEAPPSRRELAVARSLDPARARAEKRVQRFLDAAMELMDSADGKEFTVQEVVERSGQSLRSFYQYFAGKHELLLALFEESIRTTAAQVGTAVDQSDDPLERLRVFCVEYYRLCRPTPRRKGKTDPARAMGEFAQQLLTAHPKEASRAFVPLVSLLEEILDEAAAAGVIRDDLNHGRIAGIVLQAVMFNYFAATISASSVPPDEDASEDLWEILRRGIVLPS